MKRLIAILCVMLLVFSLAACGDDDKKETKKTTAAVTTEAEGTTGEDKAFGIADTTANTDGQENDVPSNENTVANMVESNKEKFAEMLGDNCVVSADGGYIVYDVYMVEFDALTDEQLEAVKLNLDTTKDSFDELAATIGAEDYCPPDYEGIMVNYRNSLGDLIWSGIGTN